MLPLFGRKPRGAACQAAVVGKGGAAEPVARPWPLPLLAAALAGSAAALGALVAWALQMAPGLPPAWAAAAGAALAVLASALPTLALALSRMGPAQTPEPAAPPAQLLVRDAETGALRAELFLELAEREWARARRYGSGAALLLVDLDRHGRIAEAHGQPAVDAVLNTLLRQTAPTLRGPDLLARLGPAQLGVFLAHADPTGALDVAERIRERAEALEPPWAALVPEPVHSGSGTLRCSVSVGVAPLRPAHLNLQALVHDAEEAVLAARHAGGNCVRAAPVA